MKSGAHRNLDGWTNRSSPSLPPLSFLLSFHPIAVVGREGEREGGKMIVHIIEADKLVPVGIFNEFCSSLVLPIHAYMEI